MNELRNLSVREISLLRKGTRPAVRGARVALKKAAVDSADEVDTIDATLEWMAEEHAKEHKVSKALAMDAVLHTPEGKSLYADRCAAMRDPELVAKRAARMSVKPGDIRKVSVSVAKAEQNIAAFARSIQRAGESYEAAEVRALDMRPSLYSDYLRAKVAASN